MNKNPTLGRLTITLDVKQYVLTIFEISAKQNLRGGPNKKGVVRLKIQKLRSGGRGGGSYLELGSNNLSTSNLSTLLLTSQIA